jgi:hypothetical protein
MRQFKSRARLTGLLVLGATIAGGLAAYHAGPLCSGSRADDQQDAQAKPKSGGLPPLVIDRSAPLLLDAAAETEDMSFLRINDSCYVCHNNYREEELAVVHAKEEMGCVDCHGDSLEHRNDEDNITPPDIMYPLAKVDSLCKECHEEHDVAAKDVLKRWQERCPEKTDIDTVACTDCHGHHRLKQRVVRWDKETGDLIVRPTAKKK